MRQPLLLRLRPFLRRDLRARLGSALLTIAVLTGLAWLGVSALTRIDSREAHLLRTALGLEMVDAVCGGIDGPECTYDDREQARADQKFDHERKLRFAVLEELAARVELGVSRLDDARSMVEGARVDSRTGALRIDNVELETALREAVVDVRPAPVNFADARANALLRSLEHHDVGHHDGAPCNMVFQDERWVCDDNIFRGGPNPRPAARTRSSQREAILRAIEHERNLLLDLETTVHTLLARDRWPSTDASTESRAQLVTDVADPSRNGDMQVRVELANWLMVRQPQALGEEQSDLGKAAANSGLSEVNRTLASLARFDDPHELSRAVFDPNAEIWQGGWDGSAAHRGTILPPSVRYRSPVTAVQRWQLLGSALLLCAAILLVVVGPVVTATSTAREREAGTLPVLRMTGLSAGDLAFAMAIGPNVFALVSGLGLLALGTMMVAATPGIGALAGVVALIVLLSAATHLTAIGLGDALGHRVNAMVVGGLLALGLLGPGLVGAIMITGDLAATGFLFGPVPATVGGAIALSGVPAVSGFGVQHVEMARMVCGYSIAAQVSLGLLCLLSWRRRVEQAWAPLFRPIEGALLALMSVGCSALTVLDLSERINVQTYDHVNFITFVATAFLMPVLGWLLVSSLVRPARASSVASVEEARRAFWRFQAFILLTGLALTAAYSTVLQRTGLGREASEVMWATISQVVLIAETLAATLLWASRRRTGKHRIFVVGLVVALLQLAMTVGVYNLEVEHVALTQKSGLPLLIGMDASPYWLAFAVVLWAAGLGLILAALLRERDRSKVDQSASNDETDGEESKGGRWLH